jgi:hypothetical protein
LKTTGLSVELKVGESVSIDNGRITVTLEDKSGRRARLNISASPDVKIRPVKASPVLEQIKRGTQV